MTTEKLLTVLATGWSSLGWAFLGSRWITSKIVVMSGTANFKPSCIISWRGQQEGRLLSTTHSCRLTKNPSFAVTSFLCRLHFRSSADFAWFFYALALASFPPSKVMNTRRKRKRLCSTSKLLSLFGLASSLGSDYGLQDVVLDIKGA